MSRTLSSTCHELYTQPLSYRVAKEAPDSFATLQVCRSVLQCVAKSCSMLQCDAVTRQYVAVSFKLLQCDAVTSLPVMTCEQGVCWGQLDYSLTNCAATIARVGYNLFNL